MFMCEQVWKLCDDEDEIIYDDLEFLIMIKVVYVFFILFLCVWFGFGNVWFFGVGIFKFKVLLYEFKNWCDSVVFSFMFWQIVICYVLIIFVFVFGIFFCVCFIFF